MTILHSPRLTLRPSTPDDRADFIALERDPEVMRYLNGGVPMVTEEPDPQADYFMPRGGEPHLWAAFEKEGGAFAGWFCLWPEGEGVAELGYRLARSTWGRGLATEGARVLTEWGFVHAGHERITATTMAVNTGSRRVMEKIGMRHVSTIPYAGLAAIDGSEHGEVWYEISRTEWPA